VAATLSRGAGGHREVPGGEGVNPMATAEANAPDNVFERLAPHTLRCSTRLGASCLRSQMPETKCSPGRLALWEPVYSL
jgi:hypothetical protein